MARTFSFAPGEFYHIYNRGTDKRNVFMSRSDRDRFLALLYLANQNEPVDLKLQGSTLLEVEERTGDPIVEIVAYCLMPNHFHLLIRELEDGGISKFMQKLTTGYTMYFNKKNERNGSLFQGRFKATHVADDRYLRYLISYIHLNPIKLLEPKWKETGITDKVRAERYLEEYGQSSYLDYFGKERPEGMILSREALPEYFSSGTDFKTFVTEWLTYSPE
ncbi:MAG: transposase [bacterium]|nr:transposase [bacterium]